MIDSDKYRGKHVTEIALTVQQYEPLSIPRQERAKSNVGEILYTKTVYHEELFLGGIPIRIEGKFIDNNTYEKMMEKLRAELKSELIKNGILR